MAIPSKSTASVSASQPKELEGGLEGGSSVDPFRGERTMIHPLNAWGVCSSPESAGEVWPIALPPSMPRAGEVFIDEFNPSPLSPGRELCCLPADVFGEGIQARLGGINHEAIE